MIKIKLILFFLIYCVVYCKSDSNSTEVKNESVSGMALQQIQDQANHQYQLVKIIDPQRVGSDSPLLFTSTLNLSRENTNIRFSLQVINTVNGLIKKVGEDENGEKLSVTDIITTLIGIYGDDEKNESYMISSILGLERIKLSKNLDELTVISGSKTLHFKKA